jgi:hypothetical protein
MHLTKIREDNRLVFETARESLPEAMDAGNEFPEIGYARLESAANRWLEVSQALDEGRPLRVHAGVLLPDRPGLPPAKRTPSYDEVSLTRAVETAISEEARLAAALERDYPYNLITRNCVSEIFRELDVALARAAHTENEALIREESIRRLGGHVAMLGSLNFVPQISALVVEDTYAVAEQLRFASYRERRPRCGRTRTRCGCSCASRTSLPRRSTVCSRTIRSSCSSPTIWWRRARCSAR